MPRPQWYRSRRPYGAGRILSAYHDKLPKRLTDVPQDPSKPNTRIPLEVMKKDYYAARGWDKNGIPTEATLRRLKIK